MSEETTQIVAFPINYFIIPRNRHALDMFSFLKNFETKAKFDKNEGSVTSHG